MGEVQEETVKHREKRQHQELLGRNLLVVLTFFQLCGILLGLGVGVGYGKQALEDISSLKADIREMRVNDVRLALLEEKISTTKNIAEDLRKVVNAEKDTSAEVIENRNKINQLEVRIATVERELTNLRRKYP